MPLLRKICIAFVVLASSIPAFAQDAAPSAAQETAPTVVVTGANRGLGFVWAKLYAERGWQVIATARKPDQAADLIALAERTGTVRIEQLDVTDTDSINGLGKRLEGVPVDILINNIGKLGDEEGQRFGEIDPASLDNFMWVNAFSALLVTERLWENILAGEQKKVAGISARVASFDVYPRIHHGLYHYKASKVALNMIMRNIALEGEVDGVSAVVLSPGVVNTYGTPMEMEGMSPEMQAAMVDIDTSVGGMIKVMDDLTLEGSGKWYRFNGDIIPW